ncbi:MAG: hypothetical protein AAF495_09690 [Pseudomonadota bacterium]
MTKRLMTSPYLMRPLRSYDEVLGQRQEPPKAMSRIELEQLIRRTLTQARDDGQHPLQQLDAALTAALQVNPRMTGLDALGTVNRVRRQVV